MSDIFISYASEDRERAKALAEALEAQGWSVWWDRTIPTGAEFDEVIDEALANARSIVVMWSRASIAKDWVLEEAEDGRKKGMLIPVFIETVTPPRGFRRYQAADLSDWDGKTTAPSFQKLVTDVADILGPPPIAAKEAERAAEAERKAKDEAERLEHERRDREARAHAAKEAKREPVKSQTKPSTPPMAARESPPQRMSRPTIWLAAAGAFLLVAGGLWYAWEQHQAWEPKNPVDFVIMAGKGGGADRMTRLMQTIIEKHNLSSKPFIPINKPGGSGAESLIYLKQHKGDDHVIMVTLNSFYTTPLRNRGLGVDITTYTPIGRMAEDTFLLWVHKDSGIKNVDEFVKAAKAKGNNWIMAGTGKGQEDQLLTSFLNSAYGLKMKYVPFKGGGRVAKELAGKHADSTVNNPSEQIGFYQAGKTVPLAAFTPERLPMFKEAPTFRELGKEGIPPYFMQRSIVGTPGMSRKAQKYYQKLFKKVYQTEEWQNYMKKKSLRGEFITGKKLMDYWKRERGIHSTILKDIGEI